MKKLFFLVIVLFSGSILYAQNVNKNEVARILKTLSSDEMEGRAVFTPGIEKAAAFIAEEFKKTGIQPVEGNSYFQVFHLKRVNFLSASGNIEGKPIQENHLNVFTLKNELKISNQSGYEVVQIKKGDQLLRKFRELIAENKNLVVFVDTAHRSMFNGLRRALANRDRTEHDIVFILHSGIPSSYDIHYTQEIKNLELKNVVGILPGKSKADEYVIFSGHYDHLGIGKPNEEQDSIFNGANDDASGITAVISLAKYFKERGGNERTLIFAAFTAEESGGYGSRHFSQKFDPEKVMAMFNIEMIGTDSKWGKNSAYITGYEKTDMGEILGKALENSPFKFHPDPYPQQNLFYRSDNATLARLGVPAHTISTSKMDNEPFYHTVNDEFETLDVDNMTEIIKAIAISSFSIIEGKATPSRVDTSQLR